MSNGYEQIYIDLLPRLSECDLAESAERLGLKALANGGVTAEFCGREYLITSAGVNPTDGEAVDVNNRSVLAHYILSRGSGEPENSFLPLARMTGMIAGQIDHDRGLMVHPLLREFGDDYDKFQSAAFKLGGVFEGSLGGGGRCWSFKVLPKIPVRVVFYEADDEFPADIQIWFDRSALRFMEFECLAFLNGCFAKALITAGGEASTADQRKRD